MHVGFVGEVHQVIDHQPIVAIDVEQPAAVGPLLADRPFQMMDQRRVSLVLLPGPDPDETVTLFNRVGLVARKTPYALPRHFDGLAIATHDQAVVATDQVAVLDIAQRKGGATVWAKILDGGHAPFFATVEDDFFTANLPPQGLGSDLVGGAGDIPGVFRIHRILRDRLVFMDPFERINLIFVKLFADRTTLMDPLKPKRGHSWT
ncbi:hypothetical protein D3C86_1491090 [compost metagenome]